MPWNVLFHEEFDLEFQAFDEDLQDELLAHAKLLQEFGPQLGRPSVDTLKGSKHANMKELRFDWKREVWRLPSIPKGRPSSLRAVTRAGQTRDGSTRN
jgi:hypothetical protein